MAQPVGVIALLEIVPGVSATAFPSEGKMVLFLAGPRDPVLPSLLILERTAGAPQLVGSCGLGRRPSGAVELGYWIARPYWGLGYATEAAEAVVGIARDALRLKALSAGHFVDNPASGRVLEKIGFRPTGEVGRRYSAARRTSAYCRLFECDLAGESADFAEAGVSEHDLEMMAA